MREGEVRDLLDLKSTIKLGSFVINSYKSIIWYILVFNLQWNTHCREV